MIKISALSTLQKLGIALAAVVTVGLLFYLWLDAYGDRRYAEGVQATDQKWEEAGKQLKADAAKSATRADDAAANRMTNFVEDHKADEEAVNEAQRNGSSPLDILFGG